MPAPDVRRRYIAGDADPVPGEVFLCSSTDDVVAAVRKAHTMPFAVRGGGHSYADRSSTDGLLILTEGLDSLAIHDGSVTVGSGLTLGALSDVLAKHGRMIPAGSCPTVGVAGIALAGGFGWRGRLHGLTCDQITGASVVLASGEVVEASEDDEPDLLWALRGAGAANFGIVTSLTLRTYPLAPLWVTYSAFDLADAVDVIDAWQRRAWQLPDAVTLELALTCPDLDDEPVTLEIFGVSPEPLCSQSRRLEPLEAARYLVGWIDRHTEPVWLPSSPVQRPSYLYVKSEFFGAPVPRDAIAALVENFSAQRVYGEYRDLEFTPWGGAYARGANSAFPHRDPLFMISHTALVGASGTLRGHARDWITRSWEILHPFGTGMVYGGYPDLTLADPLSAYYGSHLDRLRFLKSYYDPHSLFPLH